MSQEDISQKAINVTNEIFNNLMNNFSSSIPGDKCYQRAMFNQTSSSSSNSNCTVVIDVEIEEDSKRIRIKTTFGKAS